MPSLEDINRQHPNKRRTNQNRALTGRGHSLPGDAVIGGSWVRLLSPAAPSRHSLELVVLFFSAGLQFIILSRVFGHLVQLQFSLNDED